jgi:hypothetical protein
MFAKSPCQKLFPQKSTKFLVSVFPRFSGFYRVFGFFSAMGVQKHYKKRFQKNHVEKFLQKVQPKIKHRIFTIFFITFMGVSR